jgi:hypothetical protein
MDSRLDEIDVAIIKNHLHLQLRMLGKKCGQSRHHVESRKGGGCTDAQLTGKTRVGATGGGFSLIRLFYGSLGSFVETLTGLGGCQSMRGT